MTPKEKAIELVKRFKQASTPEDLAYMAALEMIEECTDGYSYSDYRRNYWEQVKQELNKLK